MFLQNFLNSFSKLLLPIFLNSLHLYPIPLCLHPNPDTITFLHILAPRTHLNGLYQLLPVDLQVLELVLLDEGVEGQGQAGGEFVD